MKKYLLILCELILVVVLLSNIVYKKEEQKLMNSKFNTILIDPGHGGRDNGANINGILEDEINLSIGKKLFEKCLDNNYLSYITRIDDNDLSSEDSSNHKNEDLKKRAEYINSLNIDYFVSIHLNIYPDENVCGPMVYYKKGDNASYDLACSVQDKLNSLTGKNKKVHIGDYYLFNYTNVPGILVECGFLSNDNERKLLINENYQNLICNAIFSGIQDNKKLN